MSDQTAWRRSSRCSPSQCVEVSPIGVRDSKGPPDAVLHVELGPFISAVKRGQVRRSP